MEPLQIEILTYAPTEFFHCLHCEVVMQSVGLGQSVHREQREALFPPDLLAEYTALADWVADVVARHGDRVRVRVVDAASLEGVYRSLRVRSRKVPVFVVGGEVWRGGLDYPALDRLIDERVQRAGRDTGSPAARDRTVSAVERNEVERAGAARDTASAAAPRSPGDTRPSGRG